MHTHFVIRTDHHSLIYLQSQKNISQGRLSRWLDTVAEYDFESQYLPGRKNTAADSLSRVETNENEDSMKSAGHSNHAERVCRSNEAERVRRSDELGRAHSQDAAWSRSDIELAALDVSPAEHKGVQQAMNGAMSLIEFNELQLVESSCSVDEAELEQIRAGYEHDRHFSEAYRILKNDLERPKEMNAWLKHFEYSEDTGLLYYQAIIGETDFRIYVPDGEIRHLLIKNAHESATTTTRHAGHYRTYLALSSTYYWPRMPKRVKEFCRKCHQCQISKASNKMPQGLYNPLPVPRERWDDISMDFVTGLPQTFHGYDSIMVVVDRLSKRAHFIPTTQDVTARGVSRLMRQHVFRLHGVPRVIVSDKDPKFMSTFWQCLTESMGIRLNMSTRNRPQTDGQTERVNRELKRLLVLYTRHNVQNWDEYLDLAEIGYNSTHNESIGMSPYEADTGCPPRHLGTFSEMQLRRLNDDAVNFNLKMKAIVKQVQDLTVEAQRRQEFYYNRHQRDVDFEPGEYVLLDRRVYGIPRLYSKLFPLYGGPFKVVRKLHEDEAKKQYGENAYELDTGNLRPEARRFNAQWMKKYHFQPHYKRAPQTREEVIRRLSEADSIVGQNQRGLLLLFRDCDPSISVLVRADDFHKHTPRELKLSLVRDWENNRTTQRAHERNLEDEIL
ncbi:hypothetical protein TRICI_005033 [Trichomonascus ciferrii]|uniref:Integrase catalytic domain-containing protein n=1 Tax=Trichomonascus ciferrii TaxID=44093 RepID=A0A642UWJ6_9ASCO|nr:hypothetical protein TRICI_005033 [Trichomonascus ciferrii]